MVLATHDASPTTGRYHGYDVARLWQRGAGLTVRRLVQSSGAVPIPRVLPGYRVALSLAPNNATLRIGRRVTTDGSFALGTTVLGQPDDAFDGEMRGRADVMLFLIEPPHLASRLDALGLPGERVELRDLPPRADIGLIDAGRRLVEVMNQGLSGNELHCEALIEAMLTRIILRHATVTSGRSAYREDLSPAKLRRLIDFIEANLSTPLRLADLAAAAALSQAHLARAFRQATGVSLHRYVLSRRLERAHALLRCPGSTVWEAAAQCGFVDAAHFSRTYKRAFGRPPSQASLLPEGEGGPA